MSGCERNKWTFKQQVVPSREIRIRMCAYATCPLRMRMHCPTSRFPETLWALARVICGDKTMDSKQEVASLRRTCKG
eukprot:12802002-Prorocentrum_lima.AAC.1